MKPLNVCVEMLVHLYLVAVELELRRIEQRFAACKARHYHIHRLYEVDDIRHRSVRHCRCDIARYRVGYRGLYVREVKLLGPCALAVEDIAEALHHYVAVAEHIRKLADFLRVLYRLVERHAEIVGAEYCKVCVVGL